MFHPVSAFIGLRYAKSSKGNHFIAFINLFSVMGIALGLIALITVVSVMNGFEGQLKSRILGVMPHVIADTRQASPQDIAKMSQIEGVRGLTTIIEAEGVAQSKKGLQGVMIQGIDAQYMQENSIISENMLSGRLDDLKAGEYDIVVGRALSVELNIRAGDKVRMIVAGASVFTPFGRVPSQRVFTVVGIYDMASELDGTVVFMHQQDTAKLMRKKPTDLLRTRLFLDDAFDYKRVEQFIPFETDNWRTRQGPLFDAVKMEKNMMALMLLLIIAVAAFNIVSALVMIVTEKQGDIAILRTQGMRQTNIMAIFLFNGLYNGIKGTFFGLAGGLILVSQLNTILDWLGAPVMLGDNGQGLPVDVQWQQVGFVALMSLLLCFCATLYPAYRAVKVQPAKALQYE